jgi:hypothetical protein
MEEKEYGRPRKILGQISIESKYKKCSGTSKKR